MEKKEIVLYGSILLNVSVILAFVFPHIGGWLMFAVLYGAIVTGVAIFFFLRSINTANDYQDIIDDYMTDIDEMLERLIPFLSPNSSLAYSEEIKALVGGLLAFRNRLEMRIKAYMEDNEDILPAPIRDMEQKQNLEPINDRATVMNLSRTNAPHLTDIPQTRQ